MIDTLEDWLKNMMDSVPNKHITLQTASFLMEILNGNPNKLNLVVFDNAGGCQFHIWAFDNEEDTRAFMKLDTFNLSMIYGYVIDGKSTLCNEQKEYPHWDLQLKDKK